MKTGFMPSHRVFALAVLLLAVLAAAQEPVPQPSPEPSTKPAIALEPPADVYLRAMQPVEIVRRSPNNITDSEMAAWGLAVVTAAHECAARKIEDFAGEDLFHFARLCQLGQQYEDAYVAARKYINNGNKQSLESARGLILRTSLSAGNLLHAERAAYDLLRNHPYDGTVHTLVQETIMTLAAADAVENSLRFVDERHDPLMAALQTGGGLALHEGSYRVPQSTLVRDALSAVYMYRAEHRVEGAQASARALLDSVRQVVHGTAASVSPLERDAMQAALRRAELLMADAPSLPVAMSSLPKGARPIVEVTYEKNITVLAFYAPWSPQRTQMFDLLASISHDYKTFPLQIFAVSTPGVVTGDSAAKPAEVLTKLLEQFGKSGSPVPLLVAADTATQDFAIDDWPMFAVVDPSGKLRFLDTLAGPEYKDGGRMHRLVAALASIAGPTAPPPAPVKGKPGRVKVPEGTLERRPK
jgi:hypothetical protein